MKVIDRDTFREWLAGANIQLCISESNTTELTFSESGSVDLYWYPSHIPSELPAFIYGALQAISNHGPYYLLRRGSDWWREDDTGIPISSQIIDDVLAQYGVANEASGALRFEEAEWKILTAIIIAFYVHGWSVSEDLFILTEERNVVIMISHHGRLIGRFPDARASENFRIGMLRNGYGLPTNSSGHALEAPKWLVPKIQ